MPNAPSPAELEEMKRMQGEVLARIASDESISPGRRLALLHNFGRSEHPGWAEREAALAAGVVPVTLVEDNIVTQADMKASGGVWELGNWDLDWIRRTPEFIAARHDAQAASHAQKAPAEIALAAAMIELEPLLPPQKDGPPCPIAPNGRHYVTVRSDCYGAAANRGSKVYFATPAEAIAAWKHSLLDYAGKVSGDTLWWRCRPEIRGDVDPNTAEPFWLVYSRLMIGNQADVVTEEAAA